MSESGTRLSRFTVGHEKRPILKTVNSTLLLEIVG